VPGSELPPENGECIGPYRIVRILGRGGMGEVFLARDDRLKRSVAIKRIRHDGEMTPTLRQRLLREAQAVAGLSHPAIVHVYDLLEGTDDDCIIMEYVQGATLAEMLKGGPLEPATALRLARDIASGLDAAHAAGIVHRDLKAENVIVTPTGQAKILDFGLAKPLASTVDDPSLTAAGFVVGTWRSMSPEQARGAEVDERSDLFSFGVLLYEMLTGHSPFRGSGAMETLSRVMSLTPPRVDTVQPGLSPRLGALTGRLLEKEPDARPQSAAEVLRELAAIAADSSSGSHSEQTISALPTGFLRPSTPPPSQALPPSAVTPQSTAGMSVIRRRGMRTVTSAVLAVVLLATFGFLIGRRFQPAQRPVAPAVASVPLRVIVLGPQVNGKRLQLAASGILTTSLGTLSSLVGVDAISSSQLPSGPVPQMAQAAAANELLVAILEETGSQGKITLRRQSPGGQILWTETFLAPIEAGDLLQLAKQVDKSLLRGYKDHRLRPGTLALAARTEDYTEFLAVKQRLDDGDVPSQEYLESLQRVMDKSPGLLDARLLAADVLLNRFLSTKKVAYRDRALDLVRGARKLARDDPRPLFTQFRIELDQPDVAAKTLARIERLLPGDPRVLVLRSNLAEREGRLDEALDDLRAAVHSSPTWRNLNSLADLESRTGHVKEARGHLNQILGISPDNVFALDSLARIELVFGDLHQAERRYQDLIDRPKPERAHYTNLGVTRIFLGRYQGAITALHKALELDPDSSDVNLNLAEAESALGRTRNAEVHFRKALSEIEKNPVPESSLPRAECLAYLGRRREARPREARRREALRWEAVAIIGKAMEQKHDDPEVLKSAALVFALVGDDASALDNVESALQKGVQPRWFRLPGFARLQGNPEFQDLISKAPGAHR
jgi:serine/threonine protein kinase/tetratricopeptide (TPR) repeat protein